MRRARGFTLLEVMISLAILFGALGLYLFSIAESRKRVDESKMLTLSTNLARAEMVEVEAKVHLDGFSLFDDTDFHDCETPVEDLGYSKDKFKCRVKVEKVSLPPAQDLTQAATGAGGAAGGAATAGAPTPTGGPGGAGGMGAMALFGQMDMIKNVLEAAIRRVTLEIEYPRRGGHGPGHLTITAYLTDPKAVDATVQIPTLR